MPERFALYYAPDTGSALWRHAAIWLGRDAATGATLEADVGGLDPERRHAVTHSARRYGFHATLKAPMALDGKLEGKDLDRAIRAWADAHAPVDIGRLVLKPIGGFLALVAAEQSAALTDFAGRVVADFDGFRAPLSEADRAKRHANASLTPRQAGYLDRYGYPYVMEDYLFHMTVSDSLDPAPQAEVRAAAENWFGPLLGEEVMLDRLVLFHEETPGAPFLRRRDYLLLGDA